jgi:hypothetical protein
MGWQKASGYNWRALVEADIGRWKRVIGRAALAKDKRQATEVAIAVDILNRMVELGRPSYVRIDNTERARDHCVQPADPCNKVAFRCCRYEGSNCNAFCEIMRRQQ